MKACVLKGNENLSCQEVDMPVPTEGEVLFKVKACGICSSDFARVFKNGAYFYPLILGHEFAGEIASGANAGKNAVVFPLLPCFKCAACCEKEYARCSNYKYLGSRCNGGMAEYVAVPEWNVKIIPSSLDCSVAALCEPAAVAVHSLKKLGKINNQSVCVCGSGTIGILCGLLARQKGAAVTFSLRGDRKKSFLKSLGFSDFVYDTDDNCQFDSVVECVGSVSSINTTVKRAKSGGKIVFVGNPEEDVVFPKQLYWKILRSELSIYGTWNSSYKNAPIDDWDIAIDFLNANQHAVSTLITDRFLLDDGIEAFNAMKNNNGLHIKGVFINEK